MQHEYNEADLIEQDKQAELDRLDAERYEKLKAALQQRRMFCVLLESESFDAAVDALPEAKG